ncbi:hypothetical protein BH23ACT5_BH23ACT5_09880 [soil metagenome]
MSARFAFTVRYRRRGWKQRQARYFRDQDAARRLVAKLRRPSWDYAPIVELTIERQELGPPETVWTLESRR